MPQPLHRHGNDTKVLVALGGNVTSSFGSPRETLLKALEKLQIESFRFSIQSGIFSTPCFPPGSGPDFVNAVAMYVTSLSAGAVLAHLHAVEKQFGRDRKARWAPRTLDLDLLFYGDAIHPDAATVQHWIDLPPERQTREVPPELLVPHPRIQDRAFVLVPLAEIAPEMCHPLTGRTVRQMLADLPADDIAEIRRL